MFRSILIKIGSLLMTINNKLLFFCIQNKNIVLYIFYDEVIYVFNVIIIFKIISFNVKYNFNDIIKVMVLLNNILLLTITMCNIH